MTQVDTVVLRKSARPLRNSLVKDVLTVTVEEVEVSSDGRSTSQRDLDSEAQSALEDLEERVNVPKDKDSDDWETASALSEVIDELTERLIEDDPDVCTPDEATLLRHELRQLGPLEFCRRTVDDGRYSVKKLLSAFGIRPPACLDEAPQMSYLSLLMLAITRELNRRVKLARYNSVDDAVELISRSKNIICLTGAGISTSLGIPDFRSKGTGLYSKLAHLGLSDPQEVFDIHQFREDPTIFYSVAKDIVPSTKRFTPTHAFIALLQERGKLLTNYSQNIDNLEEHAGIRADKLIQCHGSFATASCVECGYKTKGDAIFPEIKAGKIPKCPRCQLAVQTGTKRKRRKGPEKKRRRYNRYVDDDESDASSADATPTQGIMKPDITFFGEPLPDHFSNRLTQHDRHHVDLVIVIGTSLKVSPVSEVVSYLPAGVPQIYISREPVSHINFDIDLLGDCDVVVAELAKRLGWKLDHDMIPPSQKIEITTGLVPSRHRFTVVP